MKIKKFDTSSLPPLSDDGVVIQQVVRRGLIALSLSIICLSIAALLTVIQLTDFYQNKVNIIAEQQNYLHNMRTAARERTLLLYAMVTEEDPFKNDDNRMAFYSEGAKFALSRIKFNKSPLADNELFLVKNQWILTKSNRPLQDEIVDAIIKGNDKQALKLLRKHTIPAQNKVLNVLDKLHTSIDKRSVEINNKANAISRASVIIIISIIIIVILSAIYITRQTTYRTFNLISQLNNARDMLQKTANELIQQKNTLDHHAIVSIADRQGNISYVNDKFCEVSGYNADELLGGNHRILKSDVHSDEFYQELWKTISKGNVWQGKICNKRKDGTHYWVESTISPFLDSKGIPYQYVSIRTDISHLLEAKIQAEEASRSQSLFLSSMSHEVRTPMNAILGFSELIKMTTKDEVINKNIQEVINAGKHLLELISALFDLSELESGRLDLSYDHYSIKDIVGFCIDKKNDVAEKKSIQIDNKVASLPDIKIKVDDKRFKKVLINILSNAIKFNKENGSVIINYSVEEKGMFTLTITDTGKGIEISEQDKIFNAFDATDKKEFNVPSSGMGCIIAKNYIEKMNGSIGFESTVGEGSCFWLKIPLSEKPV